MQKIKWIGIEDERVALKKGLTGWRVVFPIKNEDNTINWKNLLLGGSIWRLIGILVLVLLILYAFSEYTQLLNITEACLRALPDNINLQLYLDNPKLNSSVFSWN